MKKADTKKAAKPLVDVNYHAPQNKIYFEDPDYIPAELRKKYKLGEFADEEEEEK